MATMIQKRDGRQVPFNIKKIEDAILKAANSVGQADIKLINSLAQEVCQVAGTMQNSIPTVENIQDAVEKILIKHGCTEIAKAYILYRANRTRVREMNTSLMKIYEELTFKPSSECNVKRENANIDGDTSMGTMLKFGSEGAKQFNKLYLLKPEHTKMHDEGDIHIHDLDFFSLTTTCCQIDLIKLFKNGFSTGHGYLREPNSINSYAALACIAIQSNQNDQHGGQSIPNFDYALADGVRKSYIQVYKKTLISGLYLLVENSDYDSITTAVTNYMSEIKNLYNLSPTIAADNGYHARELEHLIHLCPNSEAALRIQNLAIIKSLKEIDRMTYQAMESLIHNLNTMNSRAGAQTPFSSINYGTDTSAEGRMVIKNVLLANERGLGKGETPLFPIHIFKVKEGINYNPTDINYDLFKLACRVSAKRLYPNFSFIDAPYNLKYYTPGDYNTEIAYMGCRTRVIGNTYDPTREITCGRGNLSFTSINLPRLAIRAKGNISEFFELLEAAMDATIDQLVDRYHIQAARKVKNYPFLMGQGVWLDSELLGENDTVGEILKHGTLSVGFIGLAECLTSLTGKHHGQSTESQNLGLRIITRMRKRMDEESSKTKMNFSLLATPAEGLSGRFVQLDAERYGVIKGVTDKEYYTNSFHIPVGYSISAYQKIKLEAPYHELTNAGHISYVELDGDPLHNLESFERIIRFMKESGIGYGSINHPIDRDPICGYSGIIGDRCPKCGRLEDDHMVQKERIKRITRT